MLGSQNTLSEMEGSSTVTPSEATQDTRALIRTLDSDDLWLGNTLLARLVLLLTTMYDEALSQDGEDKVDTVRAALEAQGIKALDRSGSLNAEGTPDLAQVLRHGCIDVDYKNTGDLEHAFFKLIDSIGVSKRIRGNTFILNVPWGGYHCQGTQAKQLILEYKSEDKNSMFRMYFSDHKPNKTTKPIKLKLEEKHWRDLNKTPHPQQLKQRAIVAAVIGIQDLTSEEDTVKVEGIKRTVNKNLIKEQEKKLSTIIANGTQNGLTADTVYFQPLADTRGNAQYFHYQNLKDYAYRNAQPIKDPSPAQRFSQWAPYHRALTVKSLLVVAALSLVTWALTGGFEGAFFNQHSVTTLSLEANILTGVGAMLLSAAMVYFSFRYKQEFYQYDPSDPTLSDDALVPVKRAWRGFKRQWDSATIKSANEGERPDYILRGLLLATNFLLALFILVPVITVALPLLLTNFGVMDMPLIVDLAGESQLLVLAVSVIAVFVLQQMRSTWLDKHLDVHYARNAQLSKTDVLGNTMLRLEAYKRVRTEQIGPDVLATTSAYCSGDGSEVVGRTDQYQSSATAAPLSFGLNPGLTKRHIDYAAVREADFANQVAGKSGETISRPQKQEDGPLALLGGDLNMILEGSKVYKKSNP